MQVYTNPNRLNFQNADHKVVKSVIFDFSLTLNHRNDQDAFSNRRVSQ
jgi:hypothetical protein